MNKQEFLSALRRKLRGLPEEDIRRALDYYSEILADRIDEGLTEQQAVAALDNPEDIAAQLRQEYGQSHGSEEPTMASNPDPSPKTEKQGSGSSWIKNSWFWVMVLGAPIWCSVEASLISLLAGLFSIIIGLYTAVVGLFAGALGLLLVVPIFYGLRQESLLLSLGAGLICLGLGILLLFLTNAALRGFFKLCRWVFHRNKTKNGGKENFV